MVKHDAHGFDVDRRGKDWDRLFRASQRLPARAPRRRSRGFLASAGIGNDLHGALRLLAPFYDLLLIEGHKRTPDIPKLWLLGDGEDQCPPDLQNVMDVYAREDDRYSQGLELIDAWLREHWRRVPLRAAVLIGGQSTRMGQPKHLIERDGETWLARTIRMVVEVVPDVLISGAGEIRHGRAPAPAA